ncbi:MAG: hypothetical protein ACC682_13790 [Gemmatimonadota bacterium]
MADERTYGEDEVSEIFALATKVGGASLPALTEREGLTLGELQEVGREVGLAPERVAEAAATLDDRPQTLPRQTLLGAPVSVGRVVELPRAATDREWQFLVAELRETFGAKGKVTSHGDTREWTNGNLHAFLEETESGHRLRLGTRKGNAMEVVAIGAVGLFMALIMAVAMISKGKIGLELMVPGLFALAGGGALASNFLRLPRWADERERQMDHIAGRARALLEAPSLDAE